MAARPQVGILGLQGAIAEHERALRALDVDPVLVRRPDELKSLAGLVVPGGESTTMSRLAIDLRLLEPVRERIAAGLPAFGTCAGLIMLAEEVLDGRPDQRQFGGLDITVRRNAFGRQVDSFERAVPIGGLDEPFPGVFIRAPWVERTGPDVTVLSRIPVADAPPSRLGAPERAGRVVAVRQGGVLATAFHPELTGDVRLHRMFIDLLKEH